MSYSMSYYVRESRREISDFDDSNDSSMMSHDSSYSGSTIAVQAKSIAC